MFVFTLILHALAAQSSVLAIFQKFVARSWEHQAHVEEVLLLDQSQVNGEVTDLYDVSTWH